MINFQRSMTMKYSSIDNQVIILINLGIAKICENTDMCDIVSIDDAYKKIINIIDIDKMFRDEQSMLEGYVSIKKEYFNKLKSTITQDYLNAMISYLKNKSEERWNKLMKFYYEIRARYVKVIEKIAPPSKSSIKLTVKYLRKVFKKYSSIDEDDIILGFSDIQKMKTSNIKEFEIYTNAVKEFLKHLSHIIKLFFMKGKKDFISLREINDYLGKHEIPPLFHRKLDKLVKININMKLFNNSNIPLTHQIIGYGFEIIPNEKYSSKEDNSYIFKFRSYGSQEYQFVFSKNYRKKSNERKFKKVWHTIENIEKFREKWKKDLNSPDQKIKEAAIACEIIYETAIRVGNKGNQSKGKETYGLLTLLGKHLICHDNHAIISFLGKGGFNFKYELDEYHSKLICPLKKTDNGKLFSITSEYLNNYIRNRIGMEITIHKFRTLKSTNLAYKYLITNNPCKKNKEMSKQDKLNYFKEQVTKIAAQMKHHSGDKVTINTVIKNYIDPIVLNEYFKLCNIPSPKMIRTLVEYSNPDQDAYVEIPKDWEGEVYYPDKKLTFWTRFFPMDKAEEREIELKNRKLIDPAKQAYKYNEQQTQKAKG